MNLRATSLLALTLAVSSVVLSQQPPRPPTPMGPDLLALPQVQKELKLTAAQITKLRSVVRAQPGRPGDRGPGQGGPGGPMGDAPGGPGGPGEHGGPGDAGPREREHVLLKVLSKAQFARYQQIMFQVAGPIVIGRPEFATSLGLTSAQRTKIRALVEQFRPPHPDASGGRPPAPPSEATRQAASKKVLAVLTSAQVNKWKELQGVQFKLGK